MNPRVASDSARTGMPIRSHQNTRYANFRMGTKTTHVSDGSRRSSRPDAEDSASNGVQPKMQYSIEELMQLRPDEPPKDHRLISVVEPSVKRVIVDSARRPECERPYSEEEERQIRDGAFIRMDIGYKPGADRFKFIDSSENERRPNSRFVVGNGQGGGRSSASHAWRSGRAHSMRRPSPDEMFRSADAQPSEDLDQQDFEEHEQLEHSQDVVIASGPNNGVEVNGADEEPEEMVDEVQSLWWYYDNDNIIQGPFDQGTMCVWWGKGFLPPQLRVCDAEDGDFETLERSFGQNQSLFLSEVPSVWVHNKMPVVIDDPEEAYAGFAPVAQHHPDPALEVVDMTPPPAQTQPREDVHHRWKSPSMPSDDPDSDDHRQIPQPIQDIGSGYQTYEHHRYEVNEYAVRDEPVPQPTEPVRQDESHSQYSRNTVSSGGLEPKVFHSQIHDRQQEQLQQPPSPVNAPFTEQPQPSPFGKNTALGFLSETERNSHSYDGVWRDNSEVVTGFDNGYGAREDKFAGRAFDQYYPEQSRQNPQPRYTTEEYERRAFSEYYDVNNPYANSYPAYFDERPHDETPFEPYPTQEPSQHVPQHDVYPANPVDSHEAAYNNLHSNGGYHSDSSPIDHPTKPPFHSFQSNLWINEENQNRDEHYVIDSAANTPLGQSVPTVPDDNPVEQRLDDVEDSFHLSQQQQHAHTQEQSIHLALPQKITPDAPPPAPKPQPRQAASPKKRQRRRQRGSRKNKNNEVASRVHVSAPAPVSAIPHPSVPISEQNRVDPVWGANSRPSDAQPRQESVWNMSVPPDQSANHLVGSSSQPRLLPANTRPPPAPRPAQQQKRPSAASRLRQANMLNPPPPPAAGGLHRSHSAPQPNTSASNSRAKRGSQQRGAQSRQASRQNASARKSGKKRSKKSGGGPKPTRMSQEFQAWCRAELAQVKPEMDAELLIGLMGGEQNDSELRDVLMDAMGHSGRVSQFIDSLIMNRDGDQGHQKGPVGKKKKKGKR